eukprot:TRINITY_DN25403_c0_g1_i2.p1 TRINITY_DN25403_c0_g1~~TRINITY_DN25403_c0_g1_i2.p1  ORF type:complete len:278 (-),score=10.94 TRINITY_DN25403_c0_g1_i2:29-862(-)
MATRVEDLPRFHVVEHDSQTYGITDNREITQHHKKENSIGQGFLIAFYALMVIFMCCVYSKISKAIPARTSWSNLLIPYSAAVVCLAIYLFLLGRAKMKTSTVSVLCLESTVVLVILTSITVQGYLLLLRVDKRIDACYAMLFIPMYVSLLGLLLYIIVILPLCVSCTYPFNYYGAITVLYLVGIGISTYYLIVLLDLKSLRYHILQVFLPLWIVMLIHFLFSFSKIKTAWTTSAFLLLLGLYSVMQYLSSANYLEVPWWGLSLLFAGSALMGMFFL